MKTRFGLIGMLGLHCWLLPWTGLGQSGALLHTFTNPTGVPNEDFGWSVAALGTNHVLIGARWAGIVAEGQAYLFSSSGTLLTTFYDPYVVWWLDLFGTALAPMGNDRVLIGAPQADVSGGNAGVAYLFGTNGALQHTFVNPNPAYGSLFGSALAAVDQERLLVGGELTFAAYLFRTDGTLLRTFTSPVPAPEAESFGAAVAALGGQRVVIGAPENLAEGAPPLEQERAYLFDLDGTLLNTFTNPLPYNARFGYALAAVGGDRVLIGAPFASRGTTCGAACLFHTNGNLLATFWPPHPGNDQRFGGSVTALGTNRVLIGSRGGAYLFNASGVLLQTYTNASAGTNSAWSAVAALGNDRLLLGDAVSEVALLYQAPPERPWVHWIGGAGSWSDPTMWTPAPPGSNVSVHLPPGSSVYVDVPEARAGDFVVDEGGTLELPSSASLTLYGQAVNNGTMNVSGDVLSYASGDAFVQNGTLYISRGGLGMKGFDSGGNDFAFVQRGGMSVVDGTLDFEHGYIRVEGGSLNAEQDSAMRGCDAGGQDKENQSMAFVQIGGSVTINGSLETWNPSVQGGSFTVGGSGYVALGVNGSGGGNNFTQLGGTVAINGGLGYTGTDAGGVDYGQTGGDLGGSGTIYGSVVADGGTLSPGASPGKLSLTGNFTQGAGHRLVLELTGSATNQFDQLAVGGQAQLSGGLTVWLRAGYLPGLGQEFALLSCSSLTGTFTNLDLPRGVAFNYSPTGAGQVVTGAVSSQGVLFGDMHLEDAVRTTRGLPLGPVPTNQLAALQALDAYGLGITNLLGLENGLSLEWLNVCDNQFSSLAPLASCTNLTGLYFYGNQVSDLGPMAGLTELRGFGCIGNPVTNLAALAGCTNLTHLLFDQCQVSDLAPLAGLTELRELTFSANQVSDLSPLVHCTNLYLLYFDANQVTNLTPLAGLTALRELRFAFNAVSSLEPLAGCTNLTVLCCDFNQVTNLAPLAQLAQLQSLLARANLLQDIDVLTNLLALGYVDVRDNQLDLRPGSPARLIIEELLARADVDFEPQQTDGLITLLAPGWDSLGRFGFTVWANAGTTQRVWVSTNLLNWVPAGFVTNVSGTEAYLDSEATHDLRFYRLQDLR